MESGASGVVFESVTTKANIINFCILMLCVIIIKFLCRIKVQTLNLEKIKFLFIRKFIKRKINLPLTCTHGYTWVPTKIFSRDFRQNYKKTYILFNINILLILYLGKK